jgi:hypothetical protein
MCSLLGRWHILMETAKESINQQKNQPPRWHEVDLKDYPMQLADITVDITMMVTIRIWTVGVADITMMVTIGTVGVAVVKVIVTVVSAHDRGDHGVLEAFCLCMFDKTSINTSFLP